MSTESDWVRWIEQVLAQQGAWLVNIHGAGMGDAGKPDLVVCLAGAALGIEVKRAKNYPSVVQCREGMRMIRAGGRFLVAYEDFSVEHLRREGLRSFLVVQPGMDEFDVYEEAKTMKGSTFEMVMADD